MRRRFLLPALLTVTSVVLVLPVGVSQAQLATAGINEQTLQSRALDGTLRFAVWLPLSYTTSPRRRFPVIYALHGLPGDSWSFRGMTFLLPVLRRLDLQAIVVFPQGARGDDPDPEYQDVGTAREWDTALTEELPRTVDQRFRTIGSRQGRAIIGISAGGYGAAILGLHHLDRYSVVESWSGYFHATTPDGSAPMRFSDPAKARYADAHQLVSVLPEQLQRFPTRIGFFTGDHDPYPGFTAENQLFHRELSAAGVPHRFAVYAGGHDQTLWLAHATDWLRFAERALASKR